MAVAAAPTIGLMVRGRLVAMAAVGLLLGTGLGIRAVGHGAPAQYSGTALYASLIYAGIFVLRPSTRPAVAGLFAVGFCWAVEAFQLTGIPAALAARSLLARLVLGRQFDWVDVAWYPVGVVPLVVLHLVLTRRAAGSAAISGPDSRAVRPRG
jgi:hypothetical protein